MFAVKLWVDAPLFQLYEVNPPEANKLTEEPAQNAVDPLEVSASVGTKLDTTLTAGKVVEQPLASVISTSTACVVETLIEAVVSPVDQE